MAASDAGGSDLPVDENGFAWVPAWTYVGSDYVLVYNQLKKEDETGRWVPTGVWKPAGGGEPAKVGE